MILRHLELDQTLEWDETHHLCEMIIENPHFFREVIKDLTISEEEKEVSISMNGEALNFDKDLDVIFNPLKLNFNSKRAITTLLKLLVKTSVSEEFYLSTNSLKSKIVKYFDEVIAAENFEFEVLADDFTLESIAKAVSLHIVGDEEDFIELLTDYVSMMSELAGIQLFVFVNLRQLVSDQELIRLQHNLDNHQIDVLLLEGHMHNSSENVSRIVIDRDMCEI